MAWESSESETYRFQKLLWPPVPYGDEEARKTWRTALETALSDLPLFPSDGSRASFPPCAAHQNAPPASLHADVSSSTTVMAGHNRAQQNAPPASLHADVSSSTTVMVAGHNRGTWTQSLALDSVGNNDGSNDASNDRSKDAYRSAHGEHKDGGVVQRRGSLRIDCSRWCMANVPEWPLGEGRTLSEAIPTQEGPLYAWMAISEARFLEPDMAGRLFEVLTQQMGCGTREVLNRFDRDGCTPLMRCLTSGRDYISKVAWEALAMHPLVDLTLAPQVSHSATEIMNGMSSISPGTALHCAFSRCSTDHAALYILSNLTDTQLLRLLEADFAAERSSLLVRAAVSGCRLGFIQLWRRVLALFTQEFTQESTHGIVDRPHQDHQSLGNWPDPQNQPTEYHPTESHPIESHPMEYHPTEYIPVVGVSNRDGPTLTLRGLLCGVSPRGLTVFTAACEWGTNWQIMFSDLQRLGVPELARYGQTSDGRHSYRYPVTAWPWQRVENASVERHARAGRTPPRGLAWDEWLLWRFHDPVRYCVRCRDHTTNEGFAVWLVEHCVPDFALNDYDCGGQTMLMRAAAADPPMPRLLRALLARAPQLDPLQRSIHPTGTTAHTASVLSTVSRTGAGADTEPPGLFAMTVVGNLPPVGPPEGVVPTVPLRPRAGSTALECSPCQVPDPGARGGADGLVRPLIPNVAMKILSIGETEYRRLYRTPVSALVDHLLRLLPRAPHASASASASPFATRTLSLADLPRELVSLVCWYAALDAPTSHRSAILIPREAKSAAGSEASAPGAAANRVVSGRKRKRTPAHPPPHDLLLTTRCETRSGLVYNNNASPLQPQPQTQPPPIVAPEIVSGPLATRHKRSRKQT
jgi:hypothetical protein